MNKVSRLAFVLLVLALVVLILAGCAAPLTPSIGRPRDGATVKTSPVRLNGTCPDNKATITVNGQEVAVTQYGSFEAYVPLTEGENTITVVATRGDKTGTKTIKVTYAPEP
jgi:hypothetical protein